MLALLVALLFSTQAPLAGGQRPGTITGIIRDGAGQAIPGMRVGAMARPNSLEEAGRGTAMFGISETDGQGRFTLTEIPPGLYYVAAGRLDRQTFYPGTLVIEEATVITVPPGATISGLELTVSNISFGRAAEEMSSFNTRTQIPLQVQVTDDDKFPVSHRGRTVVINLEPIGGTPMPFSITSKSLSVPGPVTTDYRVTVENLPDNYAVTSITYGSTDVLAGALRLTPQNFPRPTGLTVVGAVPPAGLISALNAPAVAPSTIKVTLRQMTKAHVAGARVTGKTDVSPDRNVYLADKIATLFSNGTFEFTEVMPGLYSVFAAGINFRGPYQGASITVGDRDSEVVSFEEVPILPFERQIPWRSTGSRTGGATLSLARLRGTLVEETSRQPISDGLILLKNDTQQAVFKVDAAGKYELPPLLPGSYAMEVQVFGHVSVSRMVEVGDIDMVVDLTAKRLY